MGGGGQQIPEFPKASEEYKKGLDVYLRYLPKMERMELENRLKYDPQFIEQALGLQAQYDPRLAGLQLEALKARDPEWYAMHKGLADKIKEGLDRGYLDPRQEAAYGKLMALAGHIDPLQRAAYERFGGLAGQVDPRYEAAYGKLAGLAGTIDPEQEAAYHQAAALAGKGEPTREAAYGALGEQVTSDTLRGATADPETLRQMTQAIMSRQPGLSYGEAQDMASAVYVGQRGQALKAQRQGAAEQFLGQATPTSQRQQSLAQFYGMPSLTQQRQQSLGQFSQVTDPMRMQQASLGAFYGMPSPLQQQQQSLGAAYGMAPPVSQTLAQAGSFLSSPSVTGQINQIQGVTPPSANRYVNPNAGYQGQQFALQNYQNQLAYNQLQGQGGGGNPWMQALQGASTGASYGSIGGGYGMVGGALVGGALGAFGYPQFSDERLKNNISRTGDSTKDGIPIVEFDMAGKRWRGVIAGDVMAHRPDAVGWRSGYLTVDYDKLGIKIEEVQ
jgi:hypothetical protein